MAATATFRFPRFGIEDQAINCHEHAMGVVRTEQVVHASKDFTCRKTAHRFTLQQRLADGHKQRCRDALAGNIAHEDAEPVLGHKEKVVEVSTDFLGGLHCRENLKFLAARKWREGARHHGGLDFASDTQLAVDPFPGLGLHFQVFDEALDAQLNEIDGKPVQSRMVSAILLGTTLEVPRGKDVGGSFQHVPLCHSDTQTGCVITYASFRSTVPPPAETLFGRVADPKMIAACTNPTALGGESGTLKPYFSSEGRTITGNGNPKPWLTSQQSIDTPWVTLPGLVTAQCKSNEYATYLEVTVHGSAASKRTDEIIGDLGANGQILAMWGLHLVDVNLAMGNLVDIVGKQAKAWLSRAKP